MTTTGPVIEQFAALVASGEEWVFDLIHNAIDLGVPDLEIAECVVAWSWGGTSMDSNFDAYEGFPELEAEWFRFNEGPESKWNDARYLRERFPHAYEVSA